MNVLVAGPTSFGEKNFAKHWDIFQKTLDKATSKIKKLCIVHGGERTGVDAMATKWVFQSARHREFFLPTLIFHTDYKCKPEKRNKEMIKHVDALIVFHKGGVRDDNTKHLMQLAKDKGITIRTIWYH